MVGSGVFLPILRPMRNRRYIGGSGQARAGRGISSVDENTGRKWLEISVRGNSVETGGRTLGGGKYLVENIERRVIGI